MYKGSSKLNVRIREEARGVQVGGCDFRAWLVTRYIF